MHVRLVWNGQVQPWELIMIIGVEMMWLEELYSVTAVKAIKEDGLLLVRGLANSMNRRFIQLNL